MSASRLPSDRRTPLTTERRELRQTVAVNITGLGWAGMRSDRAESLARFFADVLGLRLIRDQPDFWVFELPDGHHLEVFGPSDTGHEHFTTGPVIGFAVEDLPAAVEELRSRGVELLGEPGESWQHFRGPDGNVYEIVSASS
jgi:catechol 2,3-dioxygenase-like lactoylglutathione lyase family enzyme